MGEECERPPANRFNELDPAVQKMLSQLEPGEIETLKYVASIPKEELRGMLKKYRDWSANSRFMQKVIGGIVVIVITAAAFGESIFKMLNFLRGSNGP